ncbi:MAG TPA: hypothetical protein VJ810_25485 [Blastocatellia bacterium]|nr:hypothetical protein [Blastocatellia bacterium]
MVTLEQLAEAALNRESLLLRNLTHDLLRENPNLSECPKPQTYDLRILAAAASLVELLALRLRQTPPNWTKDVGALPEPVYGNWFAPSHSPNLTLGDFALFT